MKVEELMIGNIVMDLDDSNDLRIINSIEPGSEETKGMYFADGIWIEDLIPVTLTEEWLLRFRFIKDGVLCDYTKKIGDKIIGYNLKSKTIHIYQYPEMCGCSIKIVEYVHKFQNIIYELTNEELTIK